MENNKKVMFVIVLVLIVGTIYYLESMKTSFQGTGVSEEMISSPELLGISGYLNSEPGIQLSDFRGKVVLIDFWTYTCINCIRTLPYLTSWDEKYKDNGLVIIGVHTPEFEFEKDYDNVLAAIKKYGINYRVVQDNDYLTWRAFKNQYWPRKYLIDAEGVIRYDHIGEGGYQETELKIQELLEEIGEDFEEEKLEKEEFQFRFRPTQELYAGYEFAIPRGQNLGNEGGFKDGANDYSFPLEIDNDVIYLDGTWKGNSDNLETFSDSKLRLFFSGASVNIVIDSLAGEVEVLLDGEYISEEDAGEDISFSNGRSFIEIDNPRLYNLVDGNYQRSLLELRFEKGMKFSAFTFGG